MHLLEWNLAVRNPVPTESPDTTHYSVADAEGNVVGAAEVVTAEADDDADSGES